MNNLKKVLSKIENEIDKKIDIKKNFIENDIDSLDLLSIVSEVEDKFKIRFNKNNLKKIKDFKSLEEIITRLK